MDNIPMLIGSRIRLYRQAKKISLSELSERIHKSKSTLSKYENGEISMDVETLFDVAKVMNLRNTLSCTGCRYCADRCPQELDIPQIVDRYNKKLYTGKLDLSGIREEKLPASCIGCGNCEAACPQKIKICQMMEELSKV